MKSAPGGMKPGFPWGWTRGWRLSRMRTSYPRRRRRSTVCEPMNPAPPVTRQRAILGLRSRARRQRVPCLDGIIPKHPHRLERVVVEVLAHQIELVEDLVRHRDDVASDGVGVEDIEEFARTRPDELDLGRLGDELRGRGHQGH